MSHLRLINSDLSQQQPVGAAICASLGYGSYCVLAMTAIYVLIRRRSLRKSRARCVLLSFIITMFLATTACFIADTRMSLLQEKILAANAQISTPFLDSWKRYAVMYSITMHVVLLMSDTIVVWRAWVLCDRRSVHVALSCCIVGSTVGNAIHVEKQIEYYYHGTPFSNIMSIVLMLLPIALTHLLATSAIAYKAWICRVSVRKHLNNISQVTRAEKVLLILIESGGLFLAVLIFVLILLLLVRSALTIYLYVTEIGIYGMAMYHVVIIILVTGRDAPCVAAFQDGTLVAPSTQVLGTRNSADSTPVINIGFNRESSGPVETKETSSLPV
ncbi:hypothetical protein C8J56DRAFT_1090459 [Mycena floridula]|nr:hypothetical protein C8J56DRAFT_1090459 [Mycena floridula]